MIPNNCGNYSLLFIHFQMSIKLHFFIISAILKSAISCVALMPGQIQLDSIKMITFFVFLSPLPLLLSHKKNHFRSKIIYIIRQSTVSSQSSMREVVATEAKSKLVSQAKLHHRRVTHL
jgi:hypothetical protein